MAITSVSSKSPVASGGSDEDSLQSQIAKLTNQIAKIGAKIQEISRSDASAKEKELQVKALRAQMDMLSQQLAHLIAEQAKRRRGSNASSEEAFKTALTNANSRGRQEPSTYSAQGLFATSPSSSSGEGKLPSIDVLA